MIQFQKARAKPALPYKERVHKRFVTERAESITVLALSGYQHGAAGWECAEGSPPSSMPVSVALFHCRTVAFEHPAAGYFGAAVRSCTTDVNCEREVALSGTFPGGDFTCEGAPGLCCVQVAPSYNRAACREAAIVVAMTLG